MKTITASIPAKTTRSKTGKVFSTPARTEVFWQDEAGHWTHDFLGAVEGILECDVIDICKRAENWTEIRRAHFRMHGFHS